MWRWLSPSCAGETDRRRRGNGSSRRQPTPPPTPPPPQPPQRRRQRQQRWQRSWRQALLHPSGERHCAKRVLNALTVAGMSAPLPCLTFGLLPLFNLMLHPQGCWSHGNAAASAGAAGPFYGTMGRRAVGTAGPLEVVAGLSTLRGGAGPAPPAQRAAPG